MYPCPGRIRTRVAQHEALHVGLRVDNNSMQFSMFWQILTCRGEARRVRYAAPSQTSEIARATIFLKPIALFF
jgi:hypothetical protein